MYYLIFTIPAFAHLIFDEIMERHAKIRHWLSDIVTGMSCFIVGVVLQDVTHSAFMGTLASWLVDIAIFDLLWNAAHRERWNYHGDPSNPHRALTDKAWDYVPWFAEPLARIWFLLCAWGVFFEMDQIVGFHYKVIHFIFE